MAAYPHDHQEPTASEPAAVQLLPLRATVAAGGDVEIEVRGHIGPAELRELRELRLWHLGDPVATTPVDQAGVVNLGPLAPGGYGIELVTGDRVLTRTAIDVTSDPRARLRYGFVASYPPERDPAGLVDNVRRLHLNAIQFYDWGYRHADLLGGGETYRDALDQPISLATVRNLAAALGQVGSDALGYAAVYAVGAQEWHQWRQAALQHGDGQPYRLGDFLFLIDPADPAWLEHLGAELAAAVASVGFDGFHLDQYGSPRKAARPDGTNVDLADSFVTMLQALRELLPDARLVFNNVNDFPTWATAHAPQDAVYIEVWEPHVTLADLARVATRARAEAGGKPVVVAAYQHVYDRAAPAAADVATSLTMATLFSHGATQLLAGEADRILVDPYYVRSHRVEPSTAGLLQRWYDFLVEHDELLLRPGIVDVTGAWVGAYNDALDVTYTSTPTIADPVPGTIWRRVTEVAGHLVVHLINLSGQTDTRWDGPKQPPGAPGPGTLRVRRVGASLPRVRVADPDRQPRLVDIPATTDGDFAVARLPEPRVWQLVVIDC
jgi:dextranase